LADTEIPAMQDAFAYCAELVRTEDRDSFIASLFAPEEHRGALHALFAFGAELARVRDVAHTALPGEIRMQWWAEVVNRERDGEANANPLASALLATMERYDLPPDILLDLIEARRFDLYEDPMPTLGDLETYLQRTSSSLIALSSLILSGAQNQATIVPAGIALGLTHILRTFPVHVARRQLYLPADMLEQHRVHLHDVFAGRSSPGLAAVFAELRAVVRRHLATAGHALKELPQDAMPAILPLAIVRPWLDRSERRDPFDPAELAAWRRQWLIWRAARNPRRIAG
jgi:15-cis-phytoene synthase